MKTAEDYFQQGQVYEKKKALKRAIESYRLALSLDKKYAQAQRRFSDQDKYFLC